MKPELIKKFSLLMLITLASNFGCGEVVDEDEGLVGPVGIDIEEPDPRKFEFVGFHPVPTEEEVNHWRAEAEQRGLPEIDLTALSLKAKPEVEDPKADELLLLLPNGRSYRRIVPPRAMNTTSVEGGPVDETDDIVPSSESYKETPPSQGDVGIGEIGVASLALTPSGFWVQGITGADDRVRTNPACCASGVGRRIVKLTGAASGTGAFIGPRHVLTAAHNVYVRGIGPFFPNLVPGQNGAGTSPWGTRSTVRVYVPQGFIDADTVAEDLKHDYALLIASGTHSDGWLGFSYGKDINGLHHRGYPSASFPCLDSEPGSNIWDAPWGDCGGFQYRQFVNGRAIAITSNYFTTLHDTQNGHSGGPFYRDRSIQGSLVGTDTSTSHAVVNRLRKASFNNLCNAIGDWPTNHNHDCY